MTQALTGANIVWAAHGRLGREIYAAHWVIGSEYRFAHDLQTHCRNTIYRMIKAGKL